VTELKPGRMSRAVFPADGVIYALLAIGVIALYGTYLNSPFVFDDADFFSGYYASQYGGEFSPFMSRYWSYATFAFQRIIFGEDPVWFRLVNVMLHVMAGGAAFLFIRTLYGLTLGSKWPVPANEEGNYRGALVFCLPAAIFLFHPAAVYGVAYLVQRSIVMATLFSLLMWWAYLRGLESGSPRWFALSVLFCYLALYSKEQSVMAPAVAVLLTLLVPCRHEIRRCLSITFLAYGGIALSVIFKLKHAIATAYEPHLMYMFSEPISHPYLSSVLTQTALFFKYAFLIWVPVTSWMSVDVREPLANIASFWHWLAFFAFIGYCLAGGLLLMKKGRAGLIGFSMLAPAMLFMTELATTRIQESFVLYRAYFWMPSVFVAIPLMAEWIAGIGAASRRIAIVACLALMSGFCVLANERLNTFASDLALWNDAINLSERRGDKTLRDRQYYNRGNAYLVAGKYELALMDFERALAWNSRQPLTYFGKGRALLQLGRLDQAKESLDRALALKPDYTGIYLVRSDVFMRMGKVEAAIADLQYACDAGERIACYIKERTHPEMRIHVSPK